MPVVDHPAGGYDLTAVFVRTHQVDAVLTSLADLDGDVLFLLNWAAGAQPLGAVLGHERVLLGFGSAGGTMDGDIVRYRPAGLLTRRVPMPIGEPDGRTTPRLDRILRTFRTAGINAKAEPRMDAWLKTHAAFSVPLGQAAYAAGGPEALADDPGAVRDMIRLMRDNLAALPVAAGPPRVRRAADAAGRAARGRAPALPAQPDGRAQRAQRHLTRDAGRARSAGRTAACRTCEGRRRKGHGCRVMNRIVIVGASAGGLATAEALRRMGLRGSDHARRRREPHRPTTVRRCPSRSSPATGTRAGSVLRPPADLDALDLDLRLGVAATGLDPRRAHRDAGRRRPTCPTTAWSSPPASGPVAFRVARASSGVYTLRTLDDAPGAAARLLPGSAAGHRRRRFHRRRGRRRRPRARRRGDVAGTGARPAGAAVGELGRALAGAVPSRPRRRPAHRSHRQRDPQARRRGHRRRPGRRQRRRGRRRAGRHRLARPNTDWLEGSGLAAGRRAGVRPVQRRRRPACTGSGTWPAGTTRCSARRCASSTAPTPPSRAWPSPATC